MDIPILSYFAGGGFLDLGFELEGFDTIWSNEISVDISKIYKSGISSALKKNKQIISNESIEDIDTTTLRKNYIENLDSDLWGIIGGPPCPDFSVGGKNKGKNGSRGKLSKKYVEQICTLQPLFFVFENVKGLIKTKSHREYFEELIIILKNNGYAVDYKLLNALDFGVPQDRERVILLGIKKDLYKKIFKRKYTNQTQWFPWVKEKYPNAKNSFNWDDLDNPENVKQIPDELKAGTYILDQEELNKLANSDEFFRPKSNKFDELVEGNTSKKSFKKLHRNRFSPTVAYGNNEVHVHPVQRRRLSVREALRLQTVPDTYIIDKDITLSIKFKVIGNGVPVKLSQAIAKSMRELLDRIPKQ